MAKKVTKEDIEKAMEEVLNDPKLKKQISDSFRNVIIYGNTVVTPLDKSWLKK